MKQVGPNPEKDSATRLRAQRRARGVVAQYIHELAAGQVRASRPRRIQARPLQALQPCEGV
jgi:hypothetical protein